MRLTNETGLPATVVRIAERCINGHPKMPDSSTFSATELLKSVRQIVLGRQHYDDIERDVQDTFSMWFGTATHDLLESIAKDDPDLMPETRLEARLGDLTISGEFDLLDVKNNILYDYKTAKIAGIESARKGQDQKWLKQLYVYAWLIDTAMSRPRPEKARIVAFATDWSKIESERKEGYPQHPIQMLEWPLDDEDLKHEVLLELEEKGNECRALLDNPELDIPKCTFDDCWCSEDWAIIPAGKERAYKKFGSEDEARAFYEEMPNKDKYRIIHRASEFRKCKYYCDCLDWCEQGQRNAAADRFVEDVTEKDELPF